MKVVRRAAGAAAVLGTTNYSFSKDVSVQASSDPSDDPARSEALFVCPPKKREHMKPGFIPIHPTTLPEAVHGDTIQLLNPLGANPHLKWPLSEREKALQQISDRQVEILELQQGFRLIQSVTLFSR
jgi:hypothetical protein